MHGLILLAALAIGQADIVPPPQPVTPGYAAQFFVEGIDEASILNARVVYYPRDGVTCWAARGWGGKPFVFFQSRDAGKYLIAVFAPPAQAGGAAMYAEQEFTVSGNPTPPPTPTPTPGEVSSVILVTESLARPGPHVIEILKLQKFLAGKKYFSRIADPDTVDGLTGKTPEWLKQALTTGAELHPRVVVGKGASAYANKFTTADAAISFIQAHGG